jgi:hypothetical protein
MASLQSFSNESERACLGVSARGNGADHAHVCPIFNACSEFVSSLGIKVAAFNAAHDACYCDELCSKLHPDTCSHGGRTFGLPKGWCGFGLKVDESAQKDVFDSWHVSFHGITKDTMVETLNGECELFLPGESTASGFQIPIREGPITSPLRRFNNYSKTHGDFDPNQIFTSPSIKYCSYEDVCCDKTYFQGSSFEVVFQLRQMPGSYSIGQHTLGASVAGQIDPLFSNDELEYYTVRKDAHVIYRLLVRRTDSGALSQV